MAHSLLLLTDIKSIRNKNAQRNQIQSPFVTEVYITQ